MSSSRHASKPYRRPYHEDLLHHLLATVPLLIGTAASVAEPRTYELPEETETLRAGSGVDAAEANCKACHSVDYILTQPPKKGKAFWEAAVAKMIKTYGAPIEETDAKAIADYLAETY
jgi:sulfite dehydrogenase (cytochrome) subunit B